MAKPSGIILFLAERWTYMALLTVSNMVKSFGKLEVLKNISFSLEKGEALAIIGSSGSGKTTLLRCLNFLEIPQKGIIKVRDNLLFDAEALDKKSEQEIRKNRLHFGMVFQSFNLFPQYTVLNNLTIAAELLAKQELKATGRYKFTTNMKDALTDIRKEALSLLERVGLSEKVNSYPHELSGGQQQRVAIARALSLSPDILCFDEPTSALDPELTGEVLKVIRSLKDENSTMIIITHEIAFAREIADKVIFMSDGVILEEGTPEAVIDNPQNQRTKEFLSRYSLR